MPHNGTKAQIGLHHPDTDIVESILADGADFARFHEKSGPVRTMDSTIRHLENESSLHASN